MRRRVDALVQTGDDVTVTICLEVNGMVSILREEVRSFGTSKRECLARRDVGDSVVSILESMRCSLYRRISAESSQGGETHFERIRLRSVVQNGSVRERSEERQESGEKHVETRVGADRLKKLKRKCRKERSESNFQRRVQNFRILVSA